MIPSSATLCRICSGELIDIRRFERDDVRLCRCARCRMELLMPQPSDECLAAQYDSYFIKRGLTQSSKENYFASILSDLKLNDVPKKILDLGAGEGHCTKACQSLFPNSEITAVEPGWVNSPVNIPRVNTIAATVESWLSSGSQERFDLMLAFDLLEHLRDPSSVLTKLATTRLEKNGRIVATFPNVESQSRKFLNRLWPQYKLEHLFYFSRDSIEELSRQAGFQTVTIRAHTKTLPLGYYLTVGSNFGPRPFQFICRMVEAVVPSPLARLNVRLGCGEWLWVARRTG